MELNPKLPVNLLRAGRILLFEPPPGIKANLLRTFSTFAPSRMMKPPNERARLYFLLAWFHAVVQERLRYSPLGWAKSYEFNEADLKVACDTLDMWIEATAMGRANLPPEKVPWEALIALMSKCIYGGKVDNGFDHRLLTSFLEKFFTPKSFGADFNLVGGDAESGTDPIPMPEGIRRDQFLSWVENLPEERQTPSWLGLPPNAERVLLTNQGSDMIGKLLKMQLLEDDDDELAYVAPTSGPGADAEGGGAGAKTVDGRPAWMRTLQTSADALIQLLPNSLQILRRTVENIKDPLYRFFEREVNLGSKLLKEIRQDLTEVIQICMGDRKQTNYHRSLVDNLVKGIVPKGWKKYTIPSGTTVSVWMSDLAQRLSQLEKLSEISQREGAKGLKSIPIWLGGLFNPEAYITATRQFVAQANSWSLEELELDVTVMDTHVTSGDDQGGFFIQGLKLQGAACAKNQLKLTSTIMTDLPPILLRWVRVQSDVESKADKINLPVYLNSHRSDLLFTVDVRIAPGQSPHQFYERGVALLGSTSL